MRFVFGDCTLDTERYELRRGGRSSHWSLAPFGSWSISCGMRGGR